MYPSESGIEWSSYGVREADLPILWEGGKGKKLTSEEIAVFKLGQPDVPRNVRAGMRNIYAIRDGYTLCVSSIIPAHTALLRIKTQQPPKLDQKTGKFKDVPWTMHVQGNEHHLDASDIHTIQ